MLSRVVNELIRAPGLTRADLCDRLGLTRGPVGTALNVLAEHGLLEQVKTPGPDHVTPIVGRPPRRIYLAGAAGYSIALDVGANALRGGLFDLRGHELHSRIAATDIGDGPLGVVAAAGPMIAGLLGEARLQADDILGIGVSIAGGVGELDVTPAGRWLDHWDADLGTALERRTGIPVTVDGVANLAAISEHLYGAGQGVKDLLYLDTSGFGVGIVIDDRPYRGAGGVAGAFGHISLRESGPLCSCGNRGCIQALAGFDAIVEDFCSPTPPTTVDDLIRIALAGDRGARRALMDAGTLIGTGLAAIVNVFNPGCIVLGGELAAADELLCTAISGALERRCIPAAAGTPLVVGKLGDRAGLLGAASLHRARAGEALIRRLGTARPMAS